MAGPEGGEKGIVDGELLAVIVYRYGAVAMEKKLLRLNCGYPEA